MIKSLESYLSRLALNPLQGKAWLIADDDLSSNVKKELVQKWDFAVRL